MPLQASSRDLPDTKQTGGITWVPKAWISQLPLVICLVLYVFHGYVIHKSAVNVPYWDDWAMFHGDNHPSSIDLSWLHRQHNEHRVATTKLLVWLQFQVNGWDYPVHLIVNFVIYGLLLLCLLWLARKALPSLPNWVSLSFTVFLLSPINWFNHFMAMQTAFHFQLLFFFVACGCLFDERQRFRELLIACVAAVLSTYSAAGGFVTTIILLVAFSAFKGMRIYKAAGKTARRRELFQIILVVGIVGIALVAWIAGYTKPPKHPALASPATLSFWAFYLNLMSLGFGLRRLSSEWGAVCVLITLVPIFGEIWKRRRNLSSIKWMTYVAVLGLLVNMVSISLGRAGFGVGAAKAERYVELVTPFIILSVCNWAVFLRHRKTWVIAVLIGLWLFCFAGFARKWGFGVYRSPAAERLEGLRCVKAYYEGAGNGLCPTIFPVPLDRFLEQAKRLNASVYRELSLSTRQQTSNACYRWHNEVTDCSVTPGSMLNRTELWASSSAHVYDGNKVLTPVPVDLFRPDVQRAGFGSGRHGFDYPTPSDVKDRRPHRIRVRFADTTNLDLRLTPRVLAYSPRKPARKQRRILTSLSRSQE